ncbi:hypothetical protein [Roseicitreum antarcticum]|uniref:Uncharacterized protein n=1 Tax=Roseicitreum antarcticum TaxID=564137 RepID=A0A1H3E461_9RHOB|nr:hypothetical protein [Roseicitreum antarcticum]SDX73513.1 hypothetical protein SAMN04488238_1183 [Roseicitreum antarcticum]
MTIEAESNHAIWVRCSTGNGDVMLIQIDANTGNCLIDAYKGGDVDPDLEPPRTLTIPRGEMLALGHMLIDMATRQKPLIYLGWDRGEEE